MNVRHKAEYNVGNGIAELQSNSSQISHSPERPKVILFGYPSQTEMSTPQPKRLAFIPTSPRPLSITPGSRILKTPLCDETIWKRLNEAGLDEDSIKRSDKAALIAYIAKLEAEVS